MTGWDYLPEMFLMLTAIVVVAIGAGLKGRD